MNTLILTVGLPRSGKSTWAQAQGLPIVCPDAIRLALHGHRFAEMAEPFVWAIARVMVKALFLAGNTRVIVDATNTTTKRRGDWASRDWKLLYKEIPMSMETCIERAKADRDDYIVPVILEMAEKFEPIDSLPSMEPRHGVVA